MGLYLLDYGAGNVRSLANTIRKLGHDFQWIASPADFDKATSLIFPGVGAFGHAIEGLQSRGLLEPLRAYIASGRPYFGICIGIQVLFTASAESPHTVGLGLIPARIESFSTADKAVPHIGWNTAKPLHSAEDPDPSHYYFVHSFRATYDHTNPDAAIWAHSTAQYGQEVFIASVCKDNVFATQFHPEKSGEAGLRLLAGWLEHPDSFAPASTSSPLPVPRAPRPGHALTKRVVACMDVRSNDDGDLVVTKGDQYDVREKPPAAPPVPASPSTSTPTTLHAGGAVRNLGKPVALAARYYFGGADELCLMNITSFRHSPLADQPMLAVVRAAAEQVFVPLTIGGGIRDSVDPDGTARPALEVAGAYFRAGADKVSIATEAVFAVERLREAGAPDGTSPIETIAAAYGRQAVVVSIDPRRVYVDLTYDGPYKDEVVFGREDGPEDERGKAWWYRCTVRGGREDRPLSVLELARGVERLGAGELVLNSIDRDGTGRGFDTALVALVKRAVSIPVIASSGAGRAEHFVEVFEKTDVEAALAAGIFHREEVTIAQVKEALAAAHINVRKGRDI